MNELTQFLNPETGGFGQGSYTRALAAGYSPTQIRQLVGGSGATAIGPVAQGLLSYGASDPQKALAARNAAAPYTRMGDRSNGMDAAGYLADQIRSSTHGSASGAEAFSGGTDASNLGGELISGWRDAAKSSVKQFGGTNYAKRYMGSGEDLTLYN